MGLRPPAPFKRLGRVRLRKLRSLLHVAQVLCVAVAVTFTLGAGDTSARYQDLGHKMMCVCSCNQILIECNHVGCPDSDGMLAELRTSLSRGDSDSLILQAFQQKYGPTVLAAPGFSRFDIVAWIMPFAVLLVGLGVTAFIVRKWKLRTVEMPAMPNSPHYREVQDRIRRETEF
jgi:cytochrome c-type biogenesis protein CcmH/NrfF